MDWALHQNQFRFDIRAEREEYERLFKHEARVLQDRMVRRGLANRTRHPAMTDWESRTSGSARADVVADERVDSCFRVKARRGRFSPQTGEE
jgi:hypothetical protein